MAENCAITKHQHAATLSEVTHERILNSVIVSQTLNSKSEKLVYFRIFRLGKKITIDIRLSRVSSKSKILHNRFARA